MLEAQGAASKDSVRFKVERFTLPNGLRVLLHQDHNIPLVSFHTWYKVGSRDEKPGVTGAAHMLEHMMFKGAEKYSGKEFDRILHANGITNNAFTSWDYTGFYQNLPSSKLELMMDMEVDRMRFLKLETQDILSERQVVAEERRWRIDNNPMGLLRETLFGGLFKGSPYEWPVIGYMQDIQSYDRDKLKYFYDTFYVPNNAVLVLAGDLDTEKAKNWVQKFYGGLPAKPLSQERKYNRPEPLKESRFVTLRKKVQSKQMMLGFHSADAHHGDQYALEVAAHILGGGKSSRLYQKFVYGEQSLVSVAAYQLSNDASGAFVISAVLRDGQSEAEIYKKLRSAVRQVLDEGIGAEEIQKAKNRIMKDFVEELMTLDGRARLLAVNEILYGDYQKMYSDLDRYQSVTSKDVERIIKTYIVDQPDLTVALIPEK